MVCKSPARRRWHKAFLAMLPQILNYASFSFRHLKAEAKAEAVQEAICHALQAFVGLVQLGKTAIAYPIPLARYGVKRARNGRMVGGHLNVKDVSSEYCQRLKGFVVERLGRYDEEEDMWSELVVEDKTAGPAEIARTRIDFNDWLASLRRRDRRVAEFLATGETAHAAARKFELSDARVSELRRELAEKWHRFVGDEPGKAVVAAA